MKGAVNALAGEPGVGKTRMVSHLAASVASGHDFLDRQVLHGPVLYLNFDDGQILPRMWVTRSASGLGFKFNDLPLFYFDPSENTDTTAKISDGLLNADVFNEVIMWLEGIRDITGSYPALIIIDTFESAFPQG